LFGEQEQSSVGGGAGMAAGVGEQDESKQPGHGWVAGEEVPQHASQVEGSFGQIAALQGLTGRRGVPGGEQ
jgi:hypothetical protein